MHAYQTSEAMHLLQPVGRVLLGGVFVWAGVEHFISFRPIADMMAQQHLPRPATLLVIGSVWQIIAGLCLALDIGRFWAALALVAFTIISSLMLLAFWRVEPGPAREGQRHAFILNVAVTGGLILAGAIAR